MSNAPHTFVCGGTGSGKSFLLQHCTEVFPQIAKKKNVVLSDYGGDFRQHHRFKSSDAELFNDSLRHRKNVGRFCVVDEAHLTIGRGNQAKPFKWMPTTGRHHGHIFIFITQRPTMIEPIFRSQCTWFIVFRLIAGEAEALAKETGIPIIAKAQYLDVGNFILVNVQTGESKVVRLKA